MLITPSGNPALRASSARIIEAPGSRSDGLRIMVFPVIVAMGMDQSGIIAGKSSHLDSVGAAAMSYDGLFKTPTKRTYGCHNPKGLFIAPSLHISCYFKNLPS